MGNIEAEPNGVALTGPVFPPSIGWLGRKGSRCDLTPIGPIPGPPPPCGMQKVLCRFKWLTSEPISPGFDIPTIALRFAPSR